MKSYLQLKPLWLLAAALWIAVACTAAPAAPAVEPPTTAPAQEVSTNEPTQEAPTATPAPSEQASEIASYQAAQVVRVVDGDTIEVEIDGNEYTVRYIGIDTPETVHPSRGVEPFGPEASARNKQLVEGKTVRLEKDVSETDRFGRLLRYVYVDGVMVNATLVAEGLAQVSTFPPDVKYTDMFLELQEQAREDGIGMWGVAEPATATPTAEPQQQPSSECDPSYPGVCIPPAPPDLDCGDVTYRGFEVLPPDPHNFDGNKDGIACEG
jgi:micrococcal nuclease